MCSCPRVIRIQFDEFSHTKHNHVTSTHVKKQNMKQPQKPPPVSCPFSPRASFQCITILTFNSTD